MNQTKIFSGPTFDRLMPIKAHAGCSFATMVDCNFEDDMKWGQLHLACLNSDLTLVNNLLSQGCKVDEINNGKTPLHVAV